MSPLSVLCVCLLFGVGSLALINRDLLPGHRIIGGEEVDISSHPYQLSLQVLENHICGASIISRKWAVTAAHCAASDPRFCSLRAGSRYNNGSYHKVAQIITHPKFSLNTGNYDIALLEIEGEFTYGKNVQPIKLPDRELERGELANVTGWGATSEGGAYSVPLMKLTVSVLNRKTCKDAYKDYFVVKKEMFCTGQLGEGGKSACHGDAGGPLSANGTLYGIVFWTRRCASPKYPVVYVNVAKLRPWIANITGI